MSADEETSMSMEDHEAKKATKDMQKGSIPDPSLPADLKDNPGGGGPSEGAGEGTTTGGGGLSDGGGSTGEGGGASQGGGSGN